MNRKLVPIALALTVAGAAFGADIYSPISLTRGSFNADVVVEKTAAPPIENFVTAGNDGGTNLTGNTWFESGYYPSLPQLGLPTHGSIFAAQYLQTGALGPDMNYVYQMPPDYGVNNSLWVSGNNGPRTATITITNPAVFVGLSFLEASGNGGETINYTVHHADSTTETGSFVSTDWWHGTGSAPYPAWVCQGLMSVEGNGLQQFLGTVGDLYHNEITVSSGSPVTSIDFALVGTGGRMSLFAISGSTDGVAYTNVLGLSGFNEDTVIEATAPAFGCNTAYCTATMEQGVLNYGQVYMEKGFGGQANGLPPAGTTFTNAAGNHAFTLPPDYTQPNTLLCAGTINNITYGPTGGTLTLTTPMAYQAISVLCGSTWGPKNFDVTVHHLDGSAESFPAVSAPDWYNSSGTIAGTYPATLALQSGEGFTVQTFGFNTASSDYRLFAVDITLGNTGSPVTSVDFVYSATQAQGTTAVAFIMGLAGSTGSTTPAFLPTIVTGFNEDMIVEKAAPVRPAGIYASTTASMDGGTANTGNTWYEQGYYRQFPASGLPPAGSTVHSIAIASSYVMPSSYVGPNAAYIDSTHTNANLVPAVPAPYTALSFLSSDANGYVTNRVITQYQDGTSDTNIFVSYDWFNNSPYAFSSYGRANLDSGSINNDPGHTTTPNPRLYEAQIGLNNTTSALTNIVLNFLGGSGGNSRMVVMAVSAATGPYPVIFRGIASTAPAALEGTNMTLSAWTAGTAAATAYRWQLQSNGVWINLTDGAIGVSGAASLTNTLATYPGWLTNVGSPMTGGACNFRVQASNSVAVVYSGTLTVTLLSGYPDIPAVGDPVANFGGDGANFDAGAAGTIDHLVGTSPDCKDLLRGTWSPNQPNCGIITTPSGGASIARSIRIYTANDTQGRDPTSVILDGSNDGGNTWNNILPVQTFALNANRNTQNPSQAPNPLTQYYQEFDFYGNAAAYTSYRVTFPSVNTPADNMMQVAEIQILGQSLNTTPPYFTVQPPPAQTVFVGASPTFVVVAGGAPVLHYQWYSNNVAVSGATSASFKVTNVTLANSGNAFYCNVHNGNGTTNSVVDYLTVLAAPTQAYPATVLGDKPMAFYRLDEHPDNGAGNNGTIANDYVGGFFGSYSNVVLGVPGYNPTADPDAAASFGQIANPDSMIPDINLSFAAPTGQSVAFSVEAWVQAAGLAPANDAGIVTVGYGGFEQFNLDCGGNDPAHDFRFYVRDAVGGVHGPSGTVAASDFRWHHLVGVCDEAHSNVVLYVDGMQNGITTGFNSALGILGATTPLSIGARRSGTGSDYDLQFPGTIDEVALYNYALSSTQVLAHYYAANPGPVFTVQPTNTTVSAGSTLLMYSSAYGPGTLSYQWYQSTDASASAFAPLAGQTSSNLTITSISPTLDQFYYYVVVTNTYGAMTSSVTGQPGALLTVQSGPPQISVDLPNAQLIVGGSALTLAVQAGGSLPITFQWTYNGVNLSDGGRISGSHSNILTIADVQTNDAGAYQLSILNSYSGGVPLLSALDQITVLASLDFNEGTGWQIQGTIPPTMVNNVITLTDGGTGENGSLYFQSPVEIATPWRAAFYYQVVQPVIGQGADGTCFVIQNQGPTALNGAGGSFGISGVAPSAEIELNLYSGANGGEGFAFNSNGNLGNYGGLNNTPTAPVVLDSGNPIEVVVTYGNDVMYVTLTDTGTQATWSTSVNLAALGTDLPTLVGGNTAYVGFSGATGGVSSYQKVSNFTFVSLPSLSVRAGAPGRVVISWPPTAGAFVLQSKPSLTSGTWQTVTSPITVVNGQNEAIITAVGDAFYRLVLQ